MVETAQFPFRDDGPPSRIPGVPGPGRAEAPEPAAEVPASDAGKVGAVGAVGALAAAGAGDGEDGEVAYVRPYTVTGGRTRPSGPDLPFEALVEALAGPRPQHSPESRRILDLSAGQYLSVAELSAHLRLAIGVVRVLVGDLADEGAVRVHGLTAVTSGPAPATTLSVLESVLDGISAL